MPQEVRLTVRMTQSRLRQFLEMPARGRFGLAGLVLAQVNGGSRNA